MAPSTSADYYQSSDNELGRRYLRDKFPDLNLDYFQAAVAHRYSLYPEIPEIADFDRYRGRDVLEIGVGQGSDHFMFARADARLTGVDITPRHLEMTRRFITLVGLHSRLILADAAALPFADASFDHVYCCGVLFLVEPMERAIAELRRVLRPRGTATLMLYNRRSLHYWLKTRLYYGWALGEDKVIGRRAVEDWYTDGPGYVRVRHVQPKELRTLFDAFSAVSFRTSCLTPDQIPLFDLPSPPIANWLEKKFGFFLWVQVEK